MPSYNRILELFEEIKAEKDNKAGRARNRNRLNEIKKLVTEAKRELM